MRPHANAKTPTVSVADRHALIHGHLDLARRIARKVARRVPRSVRCDDLESAAMLGLTEAANRYDPTRGEPFLAYASKRVRGAILDELRRNDLLTRRGREGARRLADATRTVEAQVGRPATADEIAAELGVSLEEVAQQRARLQSPAIVPIEDAHHVPCAGPDASPDQQYALRERKRTITEALQRLPKRELMVLSMYFQDGLTLKEIGQILGVSESRVCQLRGRALRALRRGQKN